MNKEILALIAFLIVGVYFMPQIKSATAENAPCAVCHIQNYANGGGLAVHHAMERIFVDGQSQCQVCHKTMPNGDGSWRMEIFSEQGCNSCHRYHLDGVGTYPPPANSAPVISPVENQMVWEDDTLSVPINAYDPDNNQVTLSLATNAVGARLEGTAFVYSPSYSAAGNYTATVTATDPSGLSASQTFNISVGNVNQPPTLASILPQYVNEGGGINITLAGFDPDSDAFVYSATGLPVGFTVSEGGIIGNPDFTQAGIYPVIVMVTDAGSPNLTASQTFTLNIKDINRPPVLANIPAQLGSENVLYQLTLTASDQDNDALVFAANNMPAGAVLDGNVITWTPTYEKAGNYTFEVSVTDSKDYAVQVVTLTVGNVNRPPVIISGIATVGSMEGQLLTLPIPLTQDPDGDLVALSIAGLPQGATVDQVNGIISWTPNDSQAGNYTVLFTATDAGEPPLKETVGVEIVVGDVPTTTELTVMLSANVAALPDVPLAVINSYQANIKTISPFVSAGRITPAVNQLDAFTKKVEIDLKAGKITQAMETELVSVAAKIKANLTAK